jgi:hypothetical protein
LILQLQSQFLFLRLEDLYLLIEVVMKQILRMLRLKRKLRRTHPTVGLTKVVLATCIRASTATRMSAAIIVI